MAKITTFAILIVAAVACSDSVLGPEIPADAAPFEAPVIYDAWWIELFDELETERDVARVRWFEVAGGPWYSERYDAVVGGIWVSDGRIYIAEGYTTVKSLVKHEMIHEILQGDRGHAHPIFTQYPPLSCCTVIATSSVDSP
jgi:hypothetical protein